MEKKYKVYEVSSGMCYQGFALIAANSSEEANEQIESFKRIDNNNDSDSRGYEKVDESDVIDGLWSEEKGIIKYGIYYCG